MIHRLLLLVLLAAAPARDWPATLRADAEAAHADILANHPGPVNAADPGFRAREAAVFRLLLARAGQVRDVAGYRFAFKAYVASFDDGHLQFWINDDKQLPDANWPGFLTGFAADGRQRVMTREEVAPVPLGAELTACDGVPAADLAARNVGVFEGRWGLRSTRALRGGYLLIDRHNPFIRRPATCTFRINGRARRVTLGWKPLLTAMLAARLSATSGFARPPIGARLLADGTRWYGMSDFDGDPTGAAAKALVPLIAGLRADRAALATAPAVVLDLRGNGGGSSDWSYQIAKILWGERRVAAVEAADRASYVEWRVSPATVAALDDYEKQFAAAPTPDPKVLAYFRAIGAGLRRAQAAGQPLWREPASIAEAYQASSAAVPAAEPPPLAGPVFVVTDPGCASACLDAVDLWRALGAVQIGSETSADTQYMDIRSRDLPSGLGGIGVPMKVYRGRRRGPNQPWTPVHAFPGDLTNTPALERWIAGLPERRR